EHGHVGAGDGLDRATIEPGNPRHHRSIIEAQHQASVHGHPPMPAGDHANDVATAAAGSQRHEVDDGGGTVGGDDLGLENEGITAVSARDARLLVHGSD